MVERVDEHGARVGRVDDVVDPEPGGGLQRPDARAEEIDDRLARRSRSGSASYTLRKATSTAPSMFMAQISAVGQATEMSASKLRPPHIARYPSPYPLRRTTDRRGTVARPSSKMIRAERRPSAESSAVEPTMKPGMSAKNTSGMP